MSDEPVSERAESPKRTVFICHSSADKWVADAICAALESSGVSCWIAPRDIMPGVTWPEAIMNAIEEARIMVVIVSAQSNVSPQVLREVSQGVHYQNAIIPFRVADIPLSKELQYFFSTPHWLDALTPPLEMHIEKLVGSVVAILDGQRVKPPSWAKPKPPAPGFAAIATDSEGDIRFDDMFRKKDRKAFWNWLASIFDDK